MVRIQILGSGCARCNETEKIVRNTAAELGIAADIEKVTDIKLFASMGILMTPGVVIDGAVRSQGKVPTRKDVESWLADARD